VGTKEGSEEEAGCVGAPACLSGCAVRRVPMCVPAGGGGVLVSVQRTVFISDCVLCAV